MTVSECLERCEAITARLAFLRMRDPDLWDAVKERAQVLTRLERWHYDRYRELSDVANLHHGRALEIRWELRG